MRQFVSDQRWPASSRGAQVCRNTHPRAGESCTQRRSALAVLRDTAWPISPAAHRRLVMTARNHCMIPHSMPIQLHCIFTVCRLEKSIIKPCFVRYTQLAWFVASQSQDAVRSDLPSDTIIPGSWKPTLGYLKPIKHRSEHVRNVQ